MRPIALSLALMMGSTSVGASCSVIAHRGNSSEAPENTISAFTQALGMDVDFIEFDVHLSQDGVPMVFHDPTLERTTDHGLTTPIWEMNSEDLQKLDAGSWYDELYAGERIPTLREVLALPRHHTGLMIEIKDESASPEKLAHAVAEVIQEMEPQGVLIGSIKPQILKYIREYLPHHAIIAIVETEEEWLPHLANDPEVIAISQELVTARRVDECIRAKKPLWVWTVDEENQMADLIEMKVHGLITNRPRTLKSLKEVRSQK